MRRRWLRHFRHHPGQAMVEFALAIPILIIVLFGAIEFGFIINAHVILEDTVRQASHYGSMGGTLDGAGSSVAPGCLADYAVLEDIADRLQGTTIDTNHVRSVLLYAADTNSGTDAPRSAATGDDSTGLPSTSDPNAYWNTQAYVGDYYYSDYDPGSGADISSGAGNGNGEGAIYNLFHGGAASVFSPTLTSGYTTTSPPTYATTPTCGSSLLDGQSVTNCLPYPDNSGTGTLNAACVPTSFAKGNWPPRWRNNISDKLVTLSGGSPTSDTPWPDSFGVQVTYDYQFHTPLFQVLANVFLGNSHMLRMTDQAAFMMSPPT